MNGPTPFQTIGPFFHGALACAPIAPDESAGERVRVAGRVRDGAGEPVADALLEFWHADAGFARVATDADGAFAIDTVVPGLVRGGDGSPQAPHFVVSLFARGILSRLLTRIYFDGQAANAHDPILALVPDDRRPSLIAERVAPDAYRFDIALQGAGETVFFDV